MVPPPMDGSPGGSSSYTWSLLPPLGYTRSGRPGFNRQCPTGVPWPAGMLTQATQSSPPLSSCTSLSLTARWQKSEHAGDTREGAQGSCMRSLAAGLAGPGEKQKRNRPRRVLNCRCWACKLLPPLYGSALLGVLGQLKVINLN